jgi:hypothetical protein
MAKQYKNDIFKVITELDKKNYDFFKTYTDEQYKELQPYTLLRWLSSVQGNDLLCEEYILKTNNLVNNYVFTLTEHKNLLLNLLCSCGSSKWVKHNWIALPKNDKLSKEDKIVKDFYKYDDDEWELKKETISKEEVNELLQFLGKADKMR